MKITKLFTPKTVVKVQIIVTAVSAITLGIATWVATLHIPIVEKNIENEVSIIEELRYKATKDFIQRLYAMDVNTECRINLIDLRMERMMNKRRTKLIESLLKEVKDKTSEQIVLWSSMFITDQGQKTDSNLLSIDPNIPIEQIILKFDSALTQAKKNAYYRLEELMRQINEHELQKAGYENTLYSKKFLFRLFQMVGLLTLVIAVLIDALKKIKSVT